MRRRTFRRPDRRVAWARGARHWTIGSRFGPVAVWAYRCGRRSRTVAMIRDGRERGGRHGGDLAFSVWRWSAKVSHIGV
jgi:hypothetical protein